MKYTDSDLLYEMIEALDYDAFQYGNDGAMYAQGEYHDIKNENPFNKKGELYTC